MGACSIVSLWKEMPMMRRSCLSLAILFPASFWLHFATADVGLVQRDGKSSPSLHAFWVKLVEDDRRDQGPRTVDLKRCWADLAGFYVAAYEGRRDLDELYRRSSDRLLKQKPSTERSRLIRAWKDVLGSHTFAGRDPESVRAAIANDSFRDAMWKEEEDDLAKPFTVASLMQNMRSLAEQYKKEGTYPLGRLVKLLEGVAQRTDAVLTSNDGNVLPLTGRLGMVQLLHFRVAMEQAAFSLLQGSQEGSSKVTTEPYADQTALSDAFAKSLSDHSATYLARLHARLLEDAVAIRDVSATVRVLRVGRRLDEVLANADPETRAYLRTRIKLADLWHRSVRGDFDAIVFLHGLEKRDDVGRDLAPSDRERARGTWSSLRATLQAAQHDFDGALKTLATAIPPAKEAGDPQVLELLAMQAQMQAMKNRFDLAHASVKQAKDLFGALTPRKEGPDRARRAGVLLAELVVFLNESRPADMKPLLGPALNEAFPTHYASGVHYAAAKCLAATGAEPEIIRFHLEQADTRLQGVPTAEHLEVLLELAKVLSAQGEKKQLLNKITNYMGLQEEMRRRARGTRVYWVQLFRSDADMDSIAIDLLMERYLTNRNSESLNALLWANEISRSRGVRDGIMSSWIGYMANVSDDDSNRDIFSFLNKRLFPPVPGLGETEAHLKKTVGGLDLATGRRNVLLVYLHSRKLNKVVLVRCTAKEIAAEPLQSSLSAIEAAAEEVATQQRSLLGSYHKNRLSSPKETDVDAIRCNEPCLLSGLESLTDMLLPESAVEAVAAKPDDTGLTVVVPGPLRSVPFLALRVKRDGGRRYLRDWLASFSMAPSAHCMYLLTYYAVLFDMASGEVGRPRRTQRTTLLLGSTTGPLFPMVNAHREGITRAYRGQIVPATTKKAFLESIESCDEVHVFSHGVTSPDQPLNSGVELGEDTITILDLLEPIRRLRVGGFVTLGVCSAGDAQAVRGVDGWSFATAFFHLKGAAIVAPLWELDQSYAAQFFPKLYGATGRGVDTGRAVLLAMREVAAGRDDPFKQPGILGYDSPCFWSPLVHFGYKWDANRHR
jgi:hypothetical protein